MPMSKQLPIAGKARGRLPFAPEGWPFIIPTALLALLALAACWYATAAILLLLLLFMLNFSAIPNAARLSKPVCLFRLPTAG